MCSLIFPLLKPIPSLISVKEKCVWAGAAKAVDPCQFTPRAGSGCLFLFNFLLFLVRMLLSGVQWDVTGSAGRARGRLSPCMVLGAWQTPRQEPAASISGVKTCRKITRAARWASPPAVAASGSFLFFILKLFLKLELHSSAPEGEQNMSPAIASLG